MLKIKSLPLWLGSTILIWLLSHCKANNPTNPYATLSNNNIGWQETQEQLANGNTVSGNLRTYFFYKDGSYQVVCEASDASCLVSNQNTGTWDYITDSTVQVSIFNGPILFYKIKQLTTNSLWLLDNNTKNQSIIREFVPVSQ